MTASESITLEHKLGSLWITLPDAISMYNSRDIEKSIIGNLGNESNVVLDFSKTHDIFSSGLGLVIRIRKAVTDNNGVLCLVNVNEKMREMFITLNLDKVLSIYATDIEYEVSRNEIWEKHSVKSLGFLFVAQIENRMYRINISGEMVKNTNYSLLENFIPSPEIAIYIFDFSNLELIDESGAVELLTLTEKIVKARGECRAFGIEEWLKETMEALDAAKYMNFFGSETAAIENPVKSRK